MMLVLMSGEYVWMIWLHVSNSFSPVGFVTTPVPGKSRLVLPWRLAMETPQGVLHRIWRKPLEKRFKNNTSR